MATPRTIRKPVPQLSTCKKCGNDFRYMRTMKPRNICDNCDKIRWKLNKRAQALRKGTKSALICDRSPVETPKRKGLPE